MFASVQFCSFRRKITQQHFIVKINYKPTTSEYDEKFSSTFKKPSFFGEQVQSAFIQTIHLGQGYDIEWLQKYDCL